MLVLTRKIDEQILIGEDIKLTLVRVRGNTVRIGIEAPREVRIVRGELEKLDTEKLDTTQEFELSDREQAFAHPIESTDKDPRSHHKTADSLAGATTRATINTAVNTTGESQLFVGKVRSESNEVELSRAANSKKASSTAPLARFVAS